MSASHQLVPLHDALKGKVEMKRIPRCKKHATLDIDIFCKTCKEAVCPKCLSATHSGHLFSPLEEIAAELQDEVAGFSIAMKGNEGESKKDAKALNTTLRQIEKKQGEVENDLGEMFAELHSDLDLRHAQLLGDVDNAKKVAMKEKDEAEYAAAEFAGFCSFTEGLLTQGTPHEIAGSHKEASAYCSVLYSFFHSCLTPFLFPFFRSKQEMKR